jgi:hypothetical protein
MSSPELVEGGKLIQAGAAAWAGEPGGAVEIFTATIAQPQMQWSERAARVHGLTREDVQAAAPAAEVDQALRAWLLAHGGVDGKRMIVPIGLNVAAFDMPFFRDALPSASSLIARRAVDLNAMCFAFAGWDPNPRTRAARDFAGWKKSMKVQANRILAASGVPVREHDAGFDAAQALVGLWWLQSQLAEATSVAARALQAAESPDPLARVLGAGLLERLASVPRPVLEQIVTSLGDSVNARKWFGRGQVALGGTPLQALTEGKVDLVLACAQRAGAPRA